VTLTVDPTADAARCSNWIRVPTEVAPSDRAGSIAAQVAASHQAISRGVPNTGSDPDPTACAVSASVTVKDNTVISTPW
jgi:hypothetical protein